MRSYGQVQGQKPLLGKGIERKLLLENGPGHGGATGQMRTAA